MCGQHCQCTGSKARRCSRLELCADLIVGGTTPSLALVRQVKAETGLPVRALLRPRFGDFCYDSYELARWNSWPQSWWKPGQTVL